MATKKKVLSDHKQIGKKFIPPAKHRIGLTEIHYVERLLPEVAWIGFFLCVLGHSRGASAVLEFGKACWDRSQRKFRGFPLHSSFRSLSCEDWKHVAQQLRAKRLFGDCCKALAPFLHCYPNSNPFDAIVESTTHTTGTEVMTATEVVEALFDRRSKEASLIQAAAHTLRLQTGTMKHSSEFPIPDLDAIVDRFGSPDADRACAHVRMELNMLAMFFDKDIPTDWARYFWNRGKELIPLKAAFQIPSVPTEADTHPMQRFAVEFERQCRATLDEIWSKLPVDILESEPYEVLGALLSRQCNLAVKLVRNPDLWDWHTGPIFLRAMTDTYITIAWILKDPLDRSRKFISYGLGQEKLQVEHLKTQLDHMNDPDEKRALEEIISARRAWIDAQHYSFLQEVDVGCWSGISTREMAEEAGCMDLYRFAYTPWSHAAHSIWNHIGRFDSTPSFEALHKHIRQPFYLECGPEFDVVVNAVKYLDKSFVRVQQDFKLKLSNICPYEWLMKHIEEMHAQTDDSSASAGKSPPHP